MNLKTYLKGSNSNSVVLTGANYGAIDEK